MFTAEGFGRSELDTYVATAAELVNGQAGDLPRGVRAAALPFRFPFLVDADSGQVIEPVLLFLYDRHLRGNRKRDPQGRPRWIYNTALAHAHDLNDWWKFLGATDLAWDTAGRESIQAYSDAMGAAISPMTHERIATSSMRRRLGTVLGFYAWARRRELFSGSFGDASLRRVTRSIDLDSLAHTGPRQQEVNASDLVPRREGSEDDHVHPLTSRDVRAVLQRLGPLPSEGTDGQPSRDRLACELALNTGMRVDEVAHVTVQQFLALETADPDNAWAVAPLRLTHTKGLVPRTVFVPVWLVRELATYVAGERAAALAEARARGLPTGARMLFLNGAGANAHAGRDARAATLASAFRAAAVDCRLCVNVLKNDPGTGKPYLQAMPRHSFHDLRHTFAIWLYQSRRAEGDAEPWLFIQASLGHKHLSTTLSIYLRVASDLEATASDYMAAHYRSIRDAEG